MVGRAGRRKSVAGKKFVASALLALTAGLWSPVPAVYAADSDARAKAALRLSSLALDLQTELPAGAGMRTEGQKRRSSPPPEQPSWSLSEDTARFLLWGSVIVVLVVIALNAGSNVWSFSRSRRLERDEEDDAMPAAVAVRMDKAQARADDLAESADYAEAMHVLLLQSVSELRRRLDASIASSLTSREILSSLELPSPGRTSFADIVSRVEVSYFGAHEPGREEYLACRRSFEVLRASLRQGAA